MTEQGRISSWSLGFYKACHWRNKPKPSIASKRIRVFSSFQKGYRQQATFISITFVLVFNRPQISQHFLFGATESDILPPRRCSRGIRFIRIQARAVQYQVNAGQLGRGHYKLFVLEMQYSKQPHLFFYHSKLRYKFRFIWKCIIQCQTRSVSKWYENVANINAIAMQTPESYYSYNNKSTDVLEKIL